MRNIIALPPKEAALPSPNPHPNPPPLAGEGNGGGLVPSPAYGSLVLIAMAALPHPGQDAEQSEAGEGLAGNLGSRGNSGDKEYGGRPACRVLRHRR